MKFIADMHTHTVASDHAYSTITENAKWASEIGLVYLGMTDHGVKMEDAPHRWHFCNLGVIPRFLHGVRIIKGVEANIMDYDGNLDMDDDMYGSVEWINASFHDPCCLPGTIEQNTRAYIRVLEQPKVCVLGHTDSVWYPYDVDSVTAACREKNIAIEFNHSRFRNPSSIENLKNNILPACIKNKCNIIVNSDAHFYTHIGAFDGAAQILSEMDFPKEQILNSDLDRFEAFLRSKGIKTNGELTP